MLNTEREPEKSIIPIFTVLNIVFEKDFNSPQERKCL